MAIGGGLARRGGVGQAWGDLSQVWGGLGRNLGVGEARLGGLARPGEGQGWGGAGQAWEAPLRPPGTPPIDHFL